MKTLRYFSTNNGKQCDTNSNNIYYSKNSKTILMTLQTSIYYSNIDSNNLYKTIFVFNIDSNNLYEIIFVNFLKTLVRNRNVHCQYELKQIKMNSKMKNIFKLYYSISKVLFHL